MSKKQLSTAPDGGAVAAIERSPRKWYSKNFDRPFLIIVLALLCIGTIMVFSASYYSAELRYGDPYFFARPQVMYVCIAVAALFIAANANPYNWIKKLIVPAFILILALNFVVPVIGRISHGATRWIQLGPINLQPSELLKYAIIVLYAYLLSGEAGERKRIFGLSLTELPFLILTLAACLASTVLQGHLSATIILGILGMAMMVLGGVKLKKFMIGMLILLVIITVFLLLFGDVIAERLSHVTTRLKVWQDPFKYMRDKETNDAGWQPAQSLYAIASGGFWGVGLAQSNEKHGYLPEPQNDYIFSILCEEMGFFMAVVVVLLFVALLWRGYIIAKRATNDFCRMIVMGTVIQIVLQAALNIAVVTNTLPSTGISLPFFSYGGTSLCMIMGECGILLSFSKYTYEDSVE